MRNFILTEDQLIRLFENIKSGFGDDSTPGNLRSEVTTSAIVDDNAEDKKLSKPVTTDKVANQLHPQQWGYWARY